MAFDYHYRFLCGPKASSGMPPALYPVLIMMLWLGGTIAALFTLGTTAMGVAFVAGFAIWMTAIRYSGPLDAQGISLDDIPMSEIRRPLAAIDETGWFTGSKFQHIPAVRLGKGLVLAAGLGALGYGFFLGLTAAGEGIITPSALLPMGLLLGAPLLWITMTASRLLERANDITKLYDAPGNRITLFLRSFDDDTDLNEHMIRNPATSTRMTSFEHRILAPSFGVGSVVAIGSPKDNLPRLGAGRLYCGDGEWQSIVLHLMAEATIIVMIAADKYWLSWEFAQIAKNGFLSKAVVVIPPGDEAEKKARWTALISEVEDQSLKNDLRSVDTQHALCVSFPSQNSASTITDKTSGLEVAQLYLLAMIAAVSAKLFPEQISTSRPSLAH